VGSRILVSIIHDGAGTLPYTLYSSDDGGATWQPIARAMTVNQYYAFGQLYAAGNVLYTSLGPNCSGGCIETTPPATLPPTPPNTALYYRSTDGGTTWRPVSLPTALVSFTRSASGAYYGLGETYDGNPGQPATLYWSKDGGTTWFALPTIEGVDGGYLDPSSLGANGRVMAPDGTVIAGAWHTYGQYQSMMVGYFILRPTDSAPAWRPLAPPTATSAIQVAATTNGIRLWSTQLGSDHNTHFEYVDLPQG
jgi:hypothetical protein